MLARAANDCGAGIGVLTELAYLLVSSSQPLTSFPAGSA